MRCPHLYSGQKGCAQLFSYQKGGPQLFSDQEQGPWKKKVLRTIALMETTAGINKNIYQAVESIDKIHTTSQNCVVNEDEKKYDKN